MKPIDLGVIGELGPEFTRTHCKRNGPGTSTEAAKRAQNFASGHCRVILASMQLHGPQTAKEAAATTGLTSVQVSRRTKDLEAAGFIRPAGIERDGCRVLEAVL